MALTNNEKSMAVFQLSKIIDDAKASGGISDLGEIDTEIGGLITKQGTDPSTITANELNDLKVKLAGCVFASTSSASTLWTEIASEVV